MRRGRGTTGSGADHVYIFAQGDAQQRRRRYYSNLSAQVSLRFFLLMTLVYHPAAFYLHMWLVSLLHLSVYLFSRNMRF
jgi:hypothetical protein